VLYVSPGQRNAHNFPDSDREQIAQFQGRVIPHGQQHEDSCRRLAAKRNVSEEGEPGRDHYRAPSDHTLTTT